MRKLWPLVVVLAAGCAAPRSFFVKASAAPPAPVDQRVAQRAAIRSALQRYYPQLLKRGDSGEQTVLFVTNVSGQVERTDVIRGAPPVGNELSALFQRFGDLQTDPNRVASGVTRFEPGEAGPDRIVVVWLERLASSRQRGPYSFTAAADLLRSDRKSASGQRF